MLKWHSRWTCKLSPNQSSPRVELCSPFNILSGFAGPPDLGSGLLEICWFVLNMLLHLSSILMCPTPIYSPPPRSTQRRRRWPIAVQATLPSPRATRRRRWPKAVRATPQYIPQDPKNPTSTVVKGAFLYFDQASDAQNARKLNHEPWGRDCNDHKINCSYARVEMNPNYEQRDEARRLR